MATRMYLQYVVLFAILLTVLSCQIMLPIDVSASEPKIGVEVNKEDGRLADDVMVVPSDTQRIYFEFFLDAPEKVDVSLEFKWYCNSELIFSSTGRFEKGYTVAFLERDESKSIDFPRGDYRVDVWFVNTLLTSKTFQVD